MAKIEKQEACQLYIEQEIEAGLAEGKTKYAIGKEIASWIEKLFGAKVKPHTIEQKAHRVEEKLLTNVSSGIDLDSDTQKEIVKSAEKKGIKPRSQKSKGRKKGPKKRVKKYDPLTRFSRVAALYKELNDSRRDIACVRRKSKLYKECEKLRDLMVELFPYPPASEDTIDLTVTAKEKKEV